MPEQSFTLKGSRVHNEARCYTIRLKNEYGDDGFTAVIYLDDSLGLLTVVVGTKAWTHGWGTDPGYLAAPNLSSAIRDRFSAAYICDKLSYGRAHEEYDPEATETECRRRIIELRRSGGWTAAEAREAWSALEYIPWEDDVATCRDLERIEVGERYRPFERAWEYLEQRYNEDYRRLRHGFIPAFLDVLRAEAPKEHAA